MNSVKKDKSIKFFSPEQKSLAANLNNKIQLEIIGSEDQSLDYAASNHHKSDFVESQKDWNNFFTEGNEN
jgi:hypothetical protein